MTDDPLPWTTFVERKLMFNPITLRGVSDNCLVDLDRHSIRNIESSSLYMIDGKPYCLVRTDTCTHLVRMSRDEILDLIRPKEPTPESRP